MMIGDSWSVSFGITSSKTGLISVGLLPDSKIKYTNWSHMSDVTTFPDLKIWVIPPAPAPPPMPLPPPTPPTPIPVPPPALMAPVSQAAVTVQPIFSLTTVAQPTGISTAELIAPFVALGLGSYAKVGKKVKMRKKLTMAMRDKSTDKPTKPKTKKPVGKPRKRTSYARRKTSSVINGIALPIPENTSQDRGIENNEVPQN